MAEAEKQEGQKTVVAFIAGLLIGGLLVWVFSSSPSETPVDEVTDTDTESVDSTENAASASGAQTSATRTSGGETTDTDDETEDAPVVGDGSFEIDDQTAGSVVALADVEFPENAGWIAVRDFENEIAGRILGAARFNITDGLVPDSVNLLRATEAGKTYQVVFYSENGDKRFDTKTDTVMEETAAVFTAE